MRKFFKRYITVIRFVVLFLGSYFLLAVLYALYLKWAAGSVYFPDPVTHLVARQSAAVLESFGYSVQLMADSLQKGMLLTINNQYTVNIVEGCNAVSVIILFVAFVLSFAQQFKKTVLFLLAGAVLIYVVNILRIAFLVVALYKYPEYQDFLHSVIFPGIIYGMVVLLWMAWVWKLSPKSAQ